MVIVQAYETIRVRPCAFRGDKTVSAHSPSLLRCSPAAFDLGRRIRATRQCSRGMQPKVLLLFLLGCAFSSGSTTVVQDGTPSDAVEESVHVSAVTPDAIRCQWMPNRTLPNGRWPDSCMGMVLGDPCFGQCNPGYQFESFQPRVYCNPGLNTDRWGQWGQPMGACVKIPIKCGGTPCCLTNGHFDSKTCTGNEPGDTCLGVCDPLYSGDPDTPKAKCVVRGGRARWQRIGGQCKLAGPCRVAPCKDIAFAIPDSCIQTWGFKDYTCTCNDFYRWNPNKKTCEPASLLVFSVANPVDDTQQASYIYQYTAQKSSEIGKARWQVQDNGSQSINLYNVAVGDYTTAWAVGSKGLIKKYDGNQWAVDQGGAETYDLMAVAALGPDQAWTGGTNGAALYWTGKQWVDVSINTKQTVRSIAAVTQTDGDTVWMVASDETDPNNVVSYIYKWSTKQNKWGGAPTSFPDMALRGVTALDVDAAWACGFTNKGKIQKRGVIMQYNSSTDDWSRVNFNTGLPGYMRLTDIQAIDYLNMYAVGYTEDSTPSGGTVQRGLVLSLVQNYKYTDWAVRFYSDNVEMFNAVSGASPSTTVAVGQNSDQFANSLLGVNEKRGYPAENWQKYNFQDTPRKINGSVPADAFFKGVAVAYVSAP